MSDELAQKFFDTNVRIEHLFWIPGICVQAPREFEDFIEHDLADDCAPQVFESLPFLRGMIENGARGEDVLAEMAMHRKNGFIFEASTPTPYDCRPDGSHSFSWGRYHTKWMYADTLEDMAAAAIAWANTILETAKAKAKAA